MDAVQHAGRQRPAVYPLHRASASRSRNQYALLHIPLCPSALWFYKRRIVDMVCVASCSEFTANTTSASKCPEVRSPIPLLSPVHSAHSAANQVCIGRSADCALLLPPPRLIRCAQYWSMLPALLSQRTARSIVATASDVCGPI